ncbi:TPA: hypothetical protein ACH3X3_012470 [Trebouxia sp. C0006]
MLWYLYTCYAIIQTLPMAMGWSVQCLLVSTRILLTPAGDVLHTRSLYLSSVQCPDYTIPLYSITALFPDNFHDPTAALYFADSLHDSRHLDSMVLDRLQLCCLLHISALTNLPLSANVSGERPMLNRDSYHGNGIMMSTVFMNARAQLQSKVFRQSSC